MNITYSPRKPLSRIFIITVMLIMSMMVILNNVQANNSLESKNITDSSIEENERTHEESTKEKNLIKNKDPKEKDSADRIKEDGKDEDSIKEEESTKEENSNKNLRVRITESMPYLDVNHQGEVIRIQRNQDPDYKLTNSYAKTARSCPPFCIRPIQLEGGIKTVGELELLNFLDNEVQQDKGILIDSRLEDWNVKGTIPGSVNIPFTLFRGGLEDIDTIKLLELFGVKEDQDDNWIFEDAIELMLYCNGPWCGQSQKAIKYLLKLGYPSSKIYWYRGGMQAWQSFGLTIIKP